MFGLGKRKITTSDAGAHIMRFALVPVLEPSSTDIGFHAQAASLGINGASFAFELMAFGVFVSGAAVNRNRLECGHTPATSEAILRKSVEYLHDILQKERVLHLLPEYVRHDAFEIVIVRANAYHHLAWTSRGNEDFYNRAILQFAEYCGIPKSEPLREIARSVLLVRGNAIDYWLRLFKIIN